MHVDGVMRTRIRRREDGAVAILVALSMVALCISAAMVLDFGLLRVDRQQNKSAADAAAMSGVYALVTDINTPTFYPFNGVCQAVEYLKVNAPDFGTFTSTAWSDGNGAGVPSPCTAPALTQPCIANTPASWARFTATTATNITIRIQSGYKVDDGGFSEEALPAVQGDAGDPEYGGCDQIGVLISQSRNTTIGSLASARIGSGLRSVARVQVDPPTSPFALLILERHDCDALFNDSGGAGGRIDVSGYQDNPGLIHVDSLGDGANCSSKPIIEGKNAGTCPDPSPPLPPTCGGIVAHESQTGGFPGKISAVGTSNVSDGTPKVYAGPYPGQSPTHRDLVTRKVLDDIYLKGVTQAVNNEAKPMFADATAAMVSGVNIAGFTKISCTDSGTITGTKIFVACDNYSKNASFPDATDLVFGGQISSNDLVSMPKAKRVYVVGGTSPAGIVVGSTGFFMNDQGAASCPSTFTPSAPSSAGRARLYIKTGALKASGGTFRACNTTIILMGGDSTGGACLPALSPYVATYTNTPCPGNKPGTGTLDLGGNTNVDWTAPNTIDDAAPAAESEHLDLEDLALWDETYGVQTVGGGGTMHLAGVFAAPNADEFKLSGGPSQNVKNSQYVVRKLRTTGNGTLAMQPLPSLPVAPPDLTFSLVR